MSYKMPHFPILGKISINRSNKFPAAAARQGPLSRPVWVSTYSIKGSLKLIEKLEQIGAMCMLRLF